MTDTARDRRLDRCQQYLDRAPVRRSNMRDPRMTDSHRTDSLHTRGRGCRDRSCSVGSARVRPPGSFYPTTDSGYHGEDRSNQSGLPDAAADAEHHGSPSILGATQSSTTRKSHTSSFVSHHESITRERGRRNMDPGLYGSHVMPTGSSFDLHPGARWYSVRKLSSSSIRNP